MAKPVRLELSLVDKNNERLKEWVKDITALRDATKSLKGAQDPETIGLDRQSRQLRQLSRDFGSAEQSAKGFGSSLDSIKKFAGGALGGAGAGTLGNLAGIAGWSAVIATAGVVVGQSVRMAYEFERITTRAAASLSIGTGLGLAPRLAAMRSAAYSGEPYGFNAMQMGSAMAAYGTSAGATAGQSAAAGSFIAKYARAYGLDPTAVASMVGTYQTYAGGNFQGNASALFGGAEEAGPLGRRLGEFIATATGVLANIQLANPGANYNPATATGIVASIARLGGIYATSQGVNATTGALSALTSGNATDIRRASLALRSGISPSDIILGTGGPQQQKKIFDELLRDYGHGNVEDLKFQSALVTMVGQDNARMLIGAARRSRSLGLGADTFINPPPSGAPPLAGRLTEANATPLATIDKWLATITNTQISGGDKLLQGLANVMGGNDIPMKLDVMIGLLAVIAAAQAGGGLGNVLKLLGSGGAAGGILSRLGALGGVGGAAASALSGLGVVLGTTSFNPVTGAAQIRRELMANNPALSDASTSALALNAPVTGKYASIFNAAGKKYGVPPALLAAIGLQETHLRNEIGDYGHGHGVMQIDDRYHAAWLRSHANGLDPTSNIFMAASMIAGIWQKYHDVGIVGQVYNGGHIGARTTNHYDKRLVGSVNLVTENHTDTQVTIRITKKKKSAPTGNRTAGVQANRSQ